MTDFSIRIALIFPHQLFENSEIFSILNPKIDVIYLVKDPLYFTQFRFHKLKIELHNKSISAYEVFLRNAGFKTQIITELSEISNLSGIKQIIVQDVVDNYLEKKIKKYFENHQINWLETPMFMTNNEEIQRYITEHKTHKKIYFARNFYVWQRLRLKILIDQNLKPVGGKWSWDEENRKKIPNNISIPKTFYSVSEANEKFENVNYAYDFKGAKKCLDLFLANKLANFGPFEDAIIENENFLFHSVLSPYLNIGLITPNYIVEKTLEFYSKHQEIPLQSVEGFIRQIIGWREYMRMVYITIGSKIRSKNYFGHNREIPDNFWKGETGVLPIDNAIHKIINTAYDHHIPRLMVLGNYMNLCQFEPHKTYEWFMSMFIDAYDWVMVPNVYSMALFADGGMITTKPYIAGSNYILKMSNYKKGSWCEIWDSLFWNFVGTNYEKLQKEGRLGFIGITYSKFSTEKKALYKQIANNYLNLKENN